jgi:cell surface protein SprA
MIGVRNKTDKEVNAEIWVNELRLSQFNEQGGVAAMANAALSISDIAQLNVAGRMETAGYGSIESNVLSRNMEDAYQLSVSAALEAGRLFPEKAKLQIPLYVSYSNETLSPKFDPLDTDVELSESLDTYETKAEKDSIRQMANTVHESTSFSVSNMKLDIPTTSLAAKNHDPVAIRKARMTVPLPYLTPLRNRTQIDRLLTAKWNMFA